MKKWKVYRQFGGEGQLRYVMTIDAHSATHAIRIAKRKGVTDPVVEEENE